MSSNTNRVVSEDATSSRTVTERARDLLDTLTPDGARRPPRKAVAELVDHQDVSEDRAVAAVCDAYDSHQHAPPTAVSNFVIRDGQLEQADGVPERTAPTDRWRTVTPDDRDDPTPQPRETTDAGGEPHDGAVCDHCEQPLDNAEAELCARCDRVLNDSTNADDREGGRNNCRECGAVPVRESGLCPTCESFRDQGGFAARASTKTVIREEYR